MTSYAMSVKNVKNVKTTKTEINSSCEKNNQSTYREESTITNDLPASLANGPPQFTTTINVEKANA